MYLETRTDLQQQVDKSPLNSFFVTEPLLDPRLDSAIDSGIDLESLLRIANFDINIRNGWNETALHISAAAG